MKDIPGTGSGAELFGAVGGIGTALAVDPSDPTGNTVYLGYDFGSAAKTPPATIPALPASSHPGPAGSGALAVTGLPRRLPYLALTLLVAAVLAPTLRQRRRRPGGRNGAGSG